MKKVILFVLPIIMVVNFMIGFNFKSKKVSLYLSEAEAAWFEFTEDSKNELEYEKGTVECALTGYDIFRYGTKIGFSLTPPTITIESGITYESKMVPGHKTICINGAKYRDCKDILGTLDSILGEGDCVPD